MQKRDISIFGAAFLDGFSLAGLLAPLRRPGAPTQVFADNIEPQPGASLESIDLTPREREILQFLVSASSNQEIAARLGLEEKTVKAYASDILCKLQNAAAGQSNAEAGFPPYKADSIH